MMAKQKGEPRQRSIPQRTCIACREQAGKRALVRIVRSAHGVEVDPTGKLSGRGAYLHRDRRCWERALGARVIQRALRTPLTEEEVERLTAFAREMPVHESDSSSTADIG